MATRSDKPVMFRRDLQNPAVTRAALGCAAILFLHACADSSFSGATGTRRPKVEQTQSNNGLPSGTLAPEATPEAPGFDVLEGGAPVSKIGINMDDRGGSVDYNDTAYCFTFRGAIKGSQIVSAAKQKIQVRRTNRSGCSHQMEIRILDASRNLKQTVPDYSGSNQDGQLVLDVERGDFIQVSSSAFICRGATVTRDIQMTDPYFFRIAANVCNNTGN